MFVEDYNGSTLEKDYPAEYKEKLENERKEWDRLFNLTYHDYEVIKRYVVKSLTGFLSYVTVFILDILYSQTTLKLS